MWPRTEILQLLNKIIRNASLIQKWNHTATVFDLAEKLRALLQVGICQIMITMN